MGKKKKRKSNPILKEKFKQGEKQGVEKATSYFIERYEELKKEKGIGPKTLEKVRKTFFEMYKKG